MACPPLQAPAFLEFRPPVLLETTKYNDENSFLPENPDRLSIEGRGVEFICKVEPGCLPDIPAQEVRDKSKRSSLGKSLICWQLGFICAQILFRTGHYSTVTLLEWTVMTHAILAFVTCIFWWRKPLDIHWPFTIKSTSIEPRAAYLVLQSATILWRYGKWCPDFRLQVPLNEEDERHQQGALLTQSLLCPDEELFGFKFSGWTSKNGQARREPITLNQRQVLCLQLAAFAIAKYDLNNIFEENRIMSPFLTC